MFLIPICPRHPGITGIIRLVSLRSCSHRRLTSPPSLWPGRELRKYHYRCLLLSPDQEQLGIFSRMYRSSRNRGSWRSAAQAIPDSNVVLSPRLPDGWIFSFQSSASQVAPADDLILEEIPAFPEGRGGHLCPHNRPSEGILPFIARFLGSLHEKRPCRFWQERG